MAKLDSLIRVRKHVVEQKQKFLADLYRQANELEQQKEALLCRHEEEKQMASQMGVEMLPYFGPYSDAVKGRVADLDVGLKRLETRINIAREDMRSAFAELKKIEITQARREAEERAETDKKEADELDAIGIDAYRRNLEGAED